MMSIEGISVDSTKIEAIKDWKALQSVTEIRSFLGLTDYYRIFVEGFSKLVAPLTSLTLKGKKYEWTLKCEEKELK